jgi:hypothetical protein
MGEEYTLQEESDDQLINNLDLLELSCDLVRTNISAARGVLNRFFSHFFPKQTQPDIFSELVHRFQTTDDPDLANRQASLKIGAKEKLPWSLPAAKKLIGRKLALPRA